MAKLDFKKPSGLFNSSVGAPSYTKANAVAIRLKNAERAFARRISGKR